MTSTQEAEHVGNGDAVFRTRHPKVVVELSLDDRRVDIVADGFDAGIRMSEYLEKDMVSTRLCAPFRFIVVGAPSYLAARGTPQHPDDLIDHECLTFRSQTTGALYAWELDRGDEALRVPVRGHIVVNDGLSMTMLAEGGVGLTYAFEPLVQEQLRDGRLQRGLPSWTAEVPGLFLYYPSRAQRSGPLRAFIECVRTMSTSMTT